VLTDVQRSWLDGHTAFVESYTVRRVIPYILNFSEINYVRKETRYVT
jgi:hypothetical protein